MAAPVLPPIGDNIKAWGNNLTAYLRRQLPRLYFRTPDDNPSENGIILWDETNKYPVVSKDGEFVQIVLEDGHISLTRTTDATAASANTPYALQYNEPVGNKGISLDSSDPTRIVFEKSGEYLLMFSAQISSTTSSDVSFYFWPRVNGFDAQGSTMRNSLHQNGSTLVVARSVKFDISAGDYLQVMWAVSSTSGFLDATAATATIPSAPSSTLNITRLHG